MSKANIFNSIRLVKPNRSNFDLSHDVKLSCKMGDLIPIFNCEALPGDRINIGADSIVRMAPMIAPMMHRVDISIHYFFVPYRLLWDGWENYIFNNGTTLPAHPFLRFIAGGGEPYTPLFDYLGVPEVLNSLSTLDISPFAPAAYNFIWNEYYRSQYLQSPVSYKLSDGDNSLLHSFVLLKRGWEHDYFTSALPQAQLSSPVSIPIGNIELDPNWIANNYSPRFDQANVPPIPIGDIKQNLNPYNVPQTVIDDGTNLTKAAYNPDGSLIVNPTTITDLRRSYKLQEWLERAARSGSRYIEALRAHWDEISSDARLQRPEYITGVKAPIVISEVLNTSATSTSPQGSMAGHGISLQQGKYGTYKCEEFGIYMGIMSVMPKTAYQQGVQKSFLKINNPFEYATPEFQHIGEQEITNEELYVNANAGVAKNTFGYIPRYAEYKFESNRVAGEFRTTLDYWHMGRQFASLPVLNASFIECDPTNRVFAVTSPTVDKLYCQILNKVSVNRKLSKYGEPSM